MIDIHDWEMLGQLRNRNASLSVIILTARSSIKSKVQGLDFGADDYLTIPFDISELPARLRVSMGIRLYYMYL
ncbi:MAG: response regulator [Colwellia sp.]|nr:response regulator [Colwellia sp.]